MSADREQYIVDVLVDAFEDLIESDPHAFRKKFRKMAAGPFPFYRGTACLFYADVHGREDPWVDERTKRVWIQGDLHAENYGTYMNSPGKLVFDVNDFDEAYVGHYTWDLQRMAASLALLGFAKALSDNLIHEMIETYARSYLDQVRAFAGGDRDDEFSLTLDNTEGALHDALVDARMETRIQLLESNTAIDGEDRRFTEGGGARRLDDAEKTKVLEAYERYLETIPERKRQHSVSYNVKDVVGRKGFGIGSAGLPAYNLLIEGPSQALENDVMLSMKQGNVAAPSRVVTDEKISSLLRAPRAPHRGLPTGAAGARGPLGGLVRAERQRPGGAGDLAVHRRRGLGRRHRRGRDHAAAALPRPGDGQGPLRLRRGL